MRMQAYSQYQSSMLHYDDNKRLVYHSDVEGNRIPDFYPSTSTIILGRGTDKRTLIEIGNFVFTNCSSVNEYTASESHRRLFQKVF